MRARLALLFAIVALASAIGPVACGEPTDPGAPAAPDGGEGPGSSACFGFADGTSCPGGAGNKICVRGVCSDPVCGDGVVSAPEECDRGVLNGPGSGCETTCRFTCVGSDPARSCQAEASCAASGTCDEATHTCTPGGPKPTGASCGSGKFCRGTECVDAVCGDAVVTPPETCDNGSANGAGTGCEANRSTSCTSANVGSCPTLPCNVPACGGDGRCSTTPDASKNGQSCGAGLICQSGACIAPGATCGNGVLEGGEECDLGAGNGPGTGCETICRFSCTAGSCANQNACVGAPTCQAVDVGGKAGRKCVAGPARADGSACGTGSICIAGACRPSICGDGFRDDGRQEECDDGNVTKLDACSDTCKFEQDQRVVAMKMQWDTDAYCTQNAMGDAIANIARSTFQENIDLSIRDGSVSALFTFTGDPRGQAGAVTVGNLSGAPTSTAPPYNGTSDLDWWYAAAASSIDASRTARALLTGTYAGGVLDATGRLNLITSVGGAVASLAVSSAKIRLTSGAASTPATSTGAPPGHLASEHLAPALQSYATAGGTTGSPAGQMCGNIAAASLENTAPPLSLLPGGGNTACRENYSSANRMLDIIVRGCRVTGLNLTAIKATQPDQVDPAAPVAGAGGPYKFATDPTTKRVTTCRDKNDAVVPLQTCLNAAAFSISFKYSTDRVIIK